jgi:hypothetical protein
MLQAPQEERLRFLCFSKGGSQLAVSYDTADAIDRWDLRLIRRQLAELGLDWEPQRQTIDE